MRDAVPLFNFERWQWFLWVHSGLKSEESAIWEICTDRSTINIRVSPTGFLQSDLAAKLKIDEF